MKYMLILISISVELISLKTFCQTQFNEHLINNNTHGTVSICTSDIDLDGDNDILSAVAEDDAIIWWRNDGGTPLVWTKKSIGNNFLGAKSVYTADIDNDSDVDVIGCASDGAQIAVWYNSGGNEITWTKQIVKSGYAWAHEVFACDIDSDGDIDILGASSTLNQITLHKNTGGSPIIWQHSVIEENFNQAKSVCAGDVDNDGDNDILGASLLNNEISLWQNDGTDLWTKKIVSSSFGGAHHIQLVDINNDGWLDILGAGWYANQIAWWKNNGNNPITWTKQIIGSGFARTCVAFAIDLDNDGYKDVIGSAQDGDQVAWWKNDGNDPIEWTKFIIDNNFNRVWPVHAADLDNDGDVDVIAGSGQEGTNEIKWYENIFDPTEILIEDNTQLPVKYNLYPNYPNPFNPTTVIKFQIPRIENVTLKVYDILGNEVANLMNETKEPGYYEVEFNAPKLTTGIYFYNLRTDEFCQTLKMILLR
ncbi:MAG: FG-GAP-like repeat-containing protein [bacterium]